MRKDFQPLKTLASKQVRIHKETQSTQSGIALANLDRFERFERFEQLEPAPY